MRFVLCGVIIIVCMCGEYFEMWNEHVCCRLKDVTSLSCGWTAIKKEKISALKFLILFIQS